MKLYFCHPKQSKWNINSWRIISLTFMNSSMNVNILQFIRSSHKFVPFFERLYMLRLFTYHSVSWKNVIPLSLYNFFPFFKCPYRRMFINRHMKCIHKGRHELMGWPNTMLNCNNVLFYINWIALKLFFSIYMLWNIRSRIIPRYFQINSFNSVQILRIWSIWLIDD